MGSSSLSGFHSTNFTFPEYRFVRVIHIDEEGKIILLPEVTLKINDGISTCK